MGLKSLQHQLVEPPALPQAPCPGPETALAPKLEPEVRGQPRPMPQIQISSPGWGYLPGREDGASARGGTWKRENSKILKSFSPSTSAQTHAELLPYAPPGPGLASFMENRYQHPQREHNSLCTCLWIVFSKRKDSGSESSCEAEQHVVPMESRARTGNNVAGSASYPSPSPFLPACLLFLLSGGQY